MSLHRYQTRALAGDYLRAGAGFSGSLAVLTLAPWHPVIVVVFVGLGAFCTVFGLRTWQRQMMRVEVTEAGISTAGSARPARRAVIDWRDLAELKLKYYSTRRDHTNGWMEMKLKGPRASLLLDSNLDDFATVVRQAGQAALDNRLSFNPATIGNLGALGIIVADGDTATRSTGGVTRPADSRTM